MECSKRGAGEEVGLRTLPAVHEGEPLVMYAIHPSIPACLLIGNSVVLLKHSRLRL